MNSDTEGWSSSSSCSSRERSADLRQMLDDDDDVAIGVVDDDKRLQINPQTSAPRTQTLAGFKEQGGGQKPHRVSSPFERVGSAAKARGTFTSECRPLQALWPNGKSLSLEDCMMVDAVVKGNATSHSCMNAMWHRPKDECLTYEMCEQLAALEPQVTL